MSIENTDVRPSDVIQESTRDGTAHGVLLWFDAEIAEGIRIFNGPQAEKVAQVYGCGFFPLLEPVVIERGDMISLSIRADLVEDQYLWWWHTRINSGDNPLAIKANFTQSNSLEVGPQ
jgi:protein arginine N-methyltransferase 1